ncbi:YceD family protein [Tepidibacillus sp. LV47]|uniref:YceD family protein n=1 Tax=Tepidibacillus sp. LV47 TaxID=3398228 RepID=UPI003AAC2336
MEIKTWELDRRKEELRFQYEEDLSHLVKEVDELRKISPVKVAGVAYETGGFYTVKGHLQSKAVLQCSRCLAPFDYHIEVDFTEIFIPERIETNLDQENENVHRLTSDEIDLTSLVEEIVLLEIPYAPVCQEECKGLCPVCGTNLNELQCNCDKTRIDPRLADLAKWFDQNKDSK